MNPARVAWSALAVLGATLAALALARWLMAVAQAGPVLYGEGAVAHAALLARSGAQYLPPNPPAFVAANYPPLFFQVAGWGDPFVWGRLVSIAATLSVAAAIAWRARSGGPVVALALACGWLALAPVTIWGAALKPDLLAIALTVGAVLAAGGARRPTAAGDRWAVAAGVLIALAISAKPTALFPAMALGGFLLVVRRRAAGGYAVASLTVVAAIVALTPGGPEALYRHVVGHNALPWSVERAVAPAVLGLMVLGIPLLAALLIRRPADVAQAYLVGAAGIVLAAGREGATINYLLDLSAAVALTLAPVAGRLRVSAVAPVLGAAQLFIGVALLDPLGWDPGRTRTGSWGAPERLAAARDLPAGPVLAEDSGLLIAQGRAPVVDDLFLWSRLAERRALDPAALLAVIRDGGFVRIVSETDLTALADAPAYARERWPEWLSRAVLERYTLDRREGRLHVYRPREPVH